MVDQCFFHGTKAMYHHCGIDVDRNRIFEDNKRIPDMSKNAVYITLHSRAVSINKICRCLKYSRYNVRHQTSTVGISGAGSTWLHSVFVSANRCEWIWARSEGQKSMRYPMSSWSCKVLSVTTQHLRKVSGSSLDHREMVINHIVLKWVFNHPQPSSLLGNQTSESWFQCNLLKWGSIMWCQMESLRNISNTIDIFTTKQAKLSVD